MFVPICHPLFHVTQQASTARTSRFPNSHRCLIALKPLLVISGGTPRIFTSTASIYPTAHRYGDGRERLSANLIPIPDEYKHLTARLKECSPGAPARPAIVDVLKGLNIKMINVFASVSNSSDLRILTQAITGMTGGAITRAAM